MLAGAAGLVLRARVDRAGAVVAPPRDGAREPRARGRCSRPCSRCCSSPGLIEGFVSPHAPLGVRAAIAIGSVVLLAAWIGSADAHDARAPEPRGSRHRATARFEPRREQRRRGFGRQRVEHAHARARELPQRCAPLVQQRERRRAHARRRASTPALRRARAATDRRARRTGSCAAATRSRARARWRSTDSGSATSDRISTSARRRWRSASSRSARVEVGLGARGLEREHGASPSRPLRARAARARAAPTRAPRRRTRGSPTRSPSLQRDRRDLQRRRRARGRASSTRAPAHRARPPRSSRHPPAAVERRA